MKLNVISFVQRSLGLLGTQTLPDLSNSVGVAKLRYIQSVYEAPDYRNPDTLIRHLLPPPLRWLSGLQAKIQLSKLRGYPFYYYLIARTKHYDQVFADAIHGNIGCIINIGCGSDTRAYRFAEALKLRGVTVLECDQAESIAAKKRLANRTWPTDHVTYVAIDLNDDAWSGLEDHLCKISSAALVMLEGVSPYVDEMSFARLLNFLAVKLKPGSIVAYDYKIQVTSDNRSIGCLDKKLFRLPAPKGHVIAYHEALGYEVQRVELSAELSSRLLPNLPGAEAVFAEDGLLRLAVPSQDVKVRPSLQ
jgi:methyltransferase (TIGR00027 family)